MKVVLQKVLSTTVLESSNSIAQINKGIVVYMGIEINESELSISWLINLLSKRIEITDEILLLSQFTLLAQFKGSKPSFHLAEKNSIAEIYFYKAVQEVKKAFAGRVKSGVFGKKLEIVQELAIPNIEVISS